MSTSTAFVSGDLKQGRESKEQIITVGVDGIPTISTPTDFEPGDSKQGRDVRERCEIAERRTSEFSLRWSGRRGSVTSSANQTGSTESGAKNEGELLGNLLKMSKAKTGTSSSSAFSSNYFLKFKTAELEDEYKGNVMVSSILTLCVTFWMYFIAMTSILAMRFNGYLRWARSTMIVILATFLFSHLIFATIVNLLVLALRKEWVRTKVFRWYFYSLLIFEIVIGSALIIVYDTYYTLSAVEAERYTLGVVISHLVMVYLNVRVPYREFLILTVISMISYAATFAAVLPVAIQMYGAGGAVLLYGLQYLGLVLAAGFLVIAVYFQEKMERIVFLDDKRVSKNFQIMDATVEKTEGLIKNIVPDIFARDLKDEEEVRDAITIMKKRQRRKSTSTSCSKIGSILFSRFYPHVVVVQADICDYTAFSRTIPAAMLIGVINVIFTEFDHLSHLFSIAKLTTLGDCWTGFAVATEQEDRPKICTDAVNFVRTLYDRLYHINQDEGWNFRLTTGVSISCGLVVLIGRDNYSFQLYGDSVGRSEFLQKKAEKGQSLFESTVWECFGAEEAGDVEIFDEVVLEAEGYSVEAVVNNFEIAFPSLGEDEVLGEAGEGEIDLRDVYLGETANSRDQYNTPESTNSSSGQRTARVVASPGRSSGTSGTPGTPHGKCLSDSESAHSVSTISRFLVKEFHYTQLNFIEKVLQLFLSKRFRPLFFGHWLSHLRYSWVYLSFLQGMWFVFMVFCLVCCFVLWSSSVFSVETIWNWVAVGLSAVVSSVLSIGFVPLSLYYHKLYQRVERTRSEKSQIALRRVGASIIILSCVNVLSFLLFVLAFGQISVWTSHFLDFFGMVMMNFALYENSFNISPVTGVPLNLIFTATYVCVSIDFRAEFNFFTNHLIPLCICGQLCFLMRGYCFRHVLLKNYINLHNFKVMKRKIKMQNAVNVNLVLSFVPRFVVVDILLSNSQGEIGVNKQYDVKNGAACFVQVVMNSSCDTTFYKALKSVFQSGGSEALEKAKASLLTQVECLSSYFQELENICQSASCFKVKTFNEVFLAVSGVRKTEEVVQRMARFAVKAKKYLKKEELSFRIGVSFGPFCGGLIGVENCIFDCFGECLNSAARMCAHAKENEMYVHVKSERERIELKEFHLNKEGNGEVKGMGSIDFFSLHEKN